MEQKILLDSDISIEILKNTDIGQKFIDLIKEKNTFISTVSVFELYLRTHNLSAVDVLLGNTTILDFNKRCAIKAALILKSLKNKGRMIDMRDLFIASIAIVNDCALATLNKKHFEIIKELRLF